MVVVVVAALLLPLRLPSELLPLVHGVDDVEYRTRLLPRSLQSRSPVASRNPISSSGSVRTTSTRTTVAMTSYQEYFSPGTLAVDVGPRDLFEVDDVDRDGDRQAKRVDERILDCPLGPADPFSASTEGALAAGARTGPAADWADFSTANGAVTHATRPPAVVRPHHPAALTFRSPVGSWPSGSCTPTPIYDGLTSDYDGSVSASYWPGSAGVATTAAPEPHPIGPFALPLSTDDSMPTSPMGDWSSTAPVGGDALGLHAVPSRPRPGSPPSPHSPLLRRDGIRKKNARFEIPAERNLLNIDQLIAQSNDDREIKELKQQKRLLRNRQAAYVSSPFLSLSASSSLGVRWSECEIGD